MARRQRLDADLVRRRLVASRSAAVEAIDAGRVLVNGSIADKASRLVLAADAVELLGPPPRFVSRGGDKLDAALEHFAVAVAGRRVLDAGASTGGFTDCLLQRGARQVVALDVGHGQLHPRVRADDRVVVLERFNVRDAEPSTIGGPVDMVVADLSFISLRAVLDALVACCVPGATMVLLVKPQFEAGRAAVSRGKGVITDPTIHAEVRTAVDDALVARRCTVLGWMESPLRGAQGNLELLVLARTPPSGCAP
jgi:23S rRNA (cytidine1920-2'-O)/16S rRNA (cytidine1409-2'-O)-methyltransferase